MDDSRVGDPRTEDEPRLLVLAGLLSAVVGLVEAVRQDVERFRGGVPGPRPAGAASDVVLGLVVGATTRAAGVGKLVLAPLRPVAAVAIRPPLVPERLQLLTWIRAMGQQGRDYRSRAEPVAQVIGPSIVRAILDRIDFDAIVARIDLDAIVARIDVEAILDRIDLAGLVRETIEELDLPELIRDSTGVVTSEAVVGIRMQGIQADERVSGIVDKILLRRGARKTSTPTQLGAGDAAPN